MKLKVDGIEEIEITDPSGLCNPPPVPQLPAGRGAPLPQGQGGKPNFNTPPGIPSQPPWQTWPVPDQHPAPFGPGITPVPGTFGPSIYTKHVYDPNDRVLPQTTLAERQEHWGIGSTAIQKAGVTLDREKWEKNWQSGVQPAELRQQGEEFNGG